MDTGHAVLLIDDDEATRETLSDILEDKGFRVVTAGTGQAALECTKNDCFAVALIDLKLPDMDGTKLLALLLESCPEMACFIVTGFASTDTAITALRLGAIDYFTKPLVIEKIVHSIAAALEKQAVRRALKTSLQENQCNLVIQNTINSIIQAAIEGAALEDILALTRNLLHDTDSDSDMSPPCVGADIYLTDDATRTFALTAPVGREVGGFQLCDQQKQLDCHCVSLAETGSMFIAEHDDAHYEPCCQGEPPHRHYCLAIRSKTGVVGFINVGFRQNAWPQQYEKLLLTRISVTLGDILQGILTEQQKAEAEKQYRQAQKMEALGSLAGGIAHDFNNILTAIMGYSGLVLESVAHDSQAYADLTQVMQAGNRAKELVQQILTFSRMRERELKPVQVHYFVGEALMLLQASIPTTIKIHKLVDKDCGLVMADPSQLHQVVMNLCTNAYQAMGSGHGTLDVRLEKASPASVRADLPLAMQDRDYIRFTVKDTGCGMDAETMEQIFVPYFTTKGDDQGTGLGLAVVHGIVKTMGGEILVDSSLGNGTTFTVYFPRIEDEQPPSTAALPLVGNLAGHEHVVIVDDDTAIVNVMRKMLEIKGYSVTTFVDSQQALVAFRTQPDSFDLLITDQIMPNITGIELARQIRAIRPDIPIILFSGMSDTVTTATLVELKINEFVRKPVSPNELLVVIRKILDHAVRR